MTIENGGFLLSAHRSQHPHDGTLQLLLHHACTEETKAACAELLEIFAASRVCTQMKLPPAARETAKILLEELEVAATLRGFASVTRDEFIEAVDRAWEKLQAPEGMRSICSS